EVVRVVTPGLCLDPENLDAAKNNFLVALGRGGGLAALEFSTGSLRVSALGSEAEQLAELVRLDPAEILIDGDLDDLENAIEALGGSPPLRHFELSDAVDVKQLKKLLGDAVELVESIASSEPMLRAAIIALSYAQQCQAQLPLRIQRLE